MDQKDYYQILGVDKNAGEQRIKQAYRKLAFEHHPDRNKGNAAATEKMKEINEAYATLSHPHRRQEYDALRDRYGPMARDHFRQTHSTEDIFRGSDIDQVFQEFARTFGFRNSEEIFAEFYGPGYRTFEFHGPGVSGRAFVFSGSFGSGHQAATREVTPAATALPAVPLPGILGRLLRMALRLLGIQLPERGADRRDVIRLSPEMAAKGGEVKYRCRNNGTTRSLMVKIPAGIEDGQRIRLKGLGDPGKAGGPPGDLYLQVKIKVSLFRRIKDRFR